MKELLVFFISEFPLLLSTFISIILISSGIETNLMLLTVIYPKLFTIV